MRSLLLIPASLALTAAGGIGICVALGRSPHLLEMSVAAGAVVLASLAAIVPLILSRHGDQLAVSQAALISTTLHLLIGIALAAAVMFARLAPHPAFLYWLMAFYWMTLIALVTTLTRLIKHAAPATPTNKA
jgi:hypothetical protein